MRCYLKYLDTGDRAALEAIDRVPYRPIAGSGFAAAQKIFDRGFEEIMRVRSEGKEPRQTARDLFAILRDVDFVPPAFRLADPEQHAPSPFTLLKMARDLPWYQKRSPQWVRDTFFDWSPSVYVKYTMKGVLSLLGTSIRRSFDPLREAFSSWHPHW
jgi:hypothetical protein